MAVLSTGQLTLADISKRMGPDGKVDPVAELLSQQNDILEDIVMVLVSEPYKMPAGVASAQLYIQVGCATAGGFTLDIADPWVALA